MRALRREKAWFRGYVRIYTPVSNKMAEPLLIYDQSDESEGEDTKLSTTPTSQAGNRGGYDCELVEPPPAAFQTECPVCLHVLKEPCLISCPCGQKICRECVEQIKEDGKPYPLCNKTDFTFMQDYGLERFLKEQGVWCSHKKDGCEWRGKLGGYEQHLNEDPSPENQLTGCQFVEVGCVYGGVGRGSGVATLPPTKTRSVQSVLTPVNTAVNMSQHLKMLLKTTILIAKCIQSHAPTNVKVIFLNGRTWRNM